MGARFGLVYLTIGLCAASYAQVSDTLTFDIPKARADLALIAFWYPTLTTGIAGLVLWQYGSGPIKGFAVTLVVGIIASLFTAIYVTRTFFEIYMRSADRDLPIGISLNRGGA